MKEHPKAVGDRSTLAIMLGLQEAGYRIAAVPFGENTRYDLVIASASELARVQCKSGRLRAGAVRFKTCSTYDHHSIRKPSRDYLGEVDYFAIYCRENSGVYLVPIRDLDVRVQGALRVTPPRNNQRRYVRFAADYEIAKVTVSPAPVMGSPSPEPPARAARAESRAPARAASASTSSSRRRGA
jgi:PD-(D/E)XK endonuclease